VVNRGDGWGEVEALLLPEAAGGAVDELQADMVTTASTAAMRTNMIEGVKSLMPWA
jgi:hypothetical protein